MSNDVSKQNIGSTIGSYMLFPAITTTGSAISAVKTHGLKGLKTAQNGAGFARLNETMKHQGVDVFTRASALNKGYEQYAGIIKNEAKTAKKYAKLQTKYINQGKEIPVSLKDKFFNLFRKPANKVTSESLEKAAKSAKETAEIAANKARKFVDKTSKNLTPDKAKKLDKALAITERTGFADAAAISVKPGLKAATKVGLKSSIKGFGKSVKNNFIAEISWKKSGAFNYIMTALQFFPNIINEVIPTFKEEGFAAGMKATGKTLVRAAADLFGYAAGGSVGRVIGSVAGMLIPFIPKGVGAKVGGAIGDLVGSMIVGGFVTKKVDKMVGVKEETPEEIQEQIVEAQEKIDTEEIAQAPVQKRVSEMTNEELNEHFKNMPSKYEVRQAANRQVFNKYA